MASEPRTPVWRPASPKLTTARANWYRYYAGYSTQFVRDVLDHLDLPKGATVLDPWNGSGTTTATASEAGFGVTGYDANPALVIVALARQLDVGISKSLNALTADLLEHAREEGSDAPTEPLATWFDVETAARLRGLERAIQRTQVDDGEIRSIADTGVERISTLAAFFYVALFEVTRSLVSRFRTSNPTWVKAGVARDELVSRSWDQIEAAFQQAVDQPKTAAVRFAPRRLSVPSLAPTGRLRCRCRSCSGSRPATSLIARPTTSGTRGSRGAPARGSESGSSPPENARPVPSPGSSRRG